MIGEKKAARTWASTVSYSGKFYGKWQYLLLVGNDVKEAAGLWAQMKDFRQ